MITKFIQYIKNKKMSLAGIEPASDPCQGSILTTILKGLTFFKMIVLTLILFWIKLNVYPVFDKFKLWINPLVK